MTKIVAQQALPAARVFLGSFQNSQTPGVDRRANGRLGAATNEWRSKTCLLQELAQLALADSVGE